jgi:hypothetical protein
VFPTLILLSYINQVFVFYERSDIIFKHFFCSGLPWP